MTAYKTLIPIIPHQTNHSWWQSNAPNFMCMCVQIYHDHLGQIIIHAIPYQTHCGAVEKWGERLRMCSAVAYFLE